MINRRHQPLRKRTIRLSVDATLLDRAELLGLDVPALLEASLQQHVQEEEGRRWQEENKLAIEALNRETWKHGLWNRRLRRF